ncbi:MAG TPA: hypothetical protein VHM26_17605, partial [Chitinophagaceae bacterium]|nr:hypothetical protein [Chitinophagaceae bacterium]
KQLTIGFLLVANMLIAQAPDPKLPTILPPTPEAASITKNAELKAGLYNGAMQADIPLYTITLGNFKLPVALSYSSNGTKVDEIPSRAGMNWSLSAGGVITRIVNGKPDDLSTRLSPPIANGLDTILKYYSDVTNESYNYDSEPDEFRIAAPGLSCKFVFDTTGAVVLIPYSNLKVAISTLVPGGPYHEITVTNTEGVKYFFGGANGIEITTNHTIGGKLSGFTQVGTGFFLRKIELPNKDSINFYYSVVNTKNFTGITHTVSVLAGLAFGTNCGPTIDGAPCPVGGSYFSQTISDVRYASLLLDSIKATDKSRILFTYESRQDSSGDKRFQQISSYKGDNIEKYRFLYEAPAYTTTTMNRRFFLTELQHFAIRNSVSSDTLRHYFKYKSPDLLPDRLSFSQDHYGFNNGKNNQTLLPAGSSSYGGYALADRSSDSTAATYGMLEKITYPTGGYDSIYYGGNKHSESVLIQYTADAIVAGQGSGATSVAIYTSGLLTTKRQNDAILYITASIAPICTECFPPEEGVDRIVDVYLKNLTDNTSIRRILYEYNGTMETVTLLANKTYQIELRVKGDYSEGIVELLYDSAAQNMYTTTWYHDPGVHVSNITSYDPVSAKTNKRFYKYTSVGNLNGTSALPIFALTYTAKSYEATLSCFHFGDYKVCKADVLTSNSNAYQYYYDNNAYVYTTVLESDDENFANGVTEHVYAAEAFAYGYTILGDEILQMPTNTNTWYHGYETATNFYNKNLSLVRSINNYYHVDDTVNKVVKGTVVRAKYFWPAPTLGNPVYQPDIDPYDVGEYIYQSNWIQQDSVVTREYDANGLVLKTKKIITYGSPVNVQPISSEPVNSKGQTVKEDLKYATDYTGISPYQRMINLNIITPVIEQKTYVGGNLATTIKNNYSDFSESVASGYPVIIMPQTIQAQRGAGSLETRINFYKYDQSSNPVELGKENDLKKSYIWAYNKKYPIAEATNTDSISIAHTSFETDEKGTWSFSGTPALHPTSPTGIKGYSLAGGQITRGSLSSGSTYAISYWKRDSASTVTVNGNSGTAIVTRNGWILYRHEVSGITSVTIAGTAFIDELRLHPANSQMATRTYEPLVGATSECDINNNITYFEYDSFGRLKTIRDMDKNVLKTIDYKYKQNP